MALIFQYGSNMSLARINHDSRLRGDATPVSIVRTSMLFELEFTVWSNTNKCAAANIVRTPTGRSIHGVLYEVPDYLISRETAKKFGRKSLDAIEGEGINYVRQKIELFMKDKSKQYATTYVVKKRNLCIKTDLAYVQHILDGLKENNIPEDYCQYVCEKIIENNPEIKKNILTLYQKG